MNIFKFLINFILQILLVTIFFSTLNARNLDKFSSGNYVSNYFSGILSLNDSHYDESYKYLKRLEGLEESHSSYSSKFLFSLINLGKFNEAFYYSKKLDRKKLGNFESNLIIGIYYLKIQNYELAEKYFLKMRSVKTDFILNEFLANSLLDWVSFSKLDFKNAQNRINSIDKSFENLKKIQNAFVHCYYKKPETKFIYEKLTLNEKVNFSRYNYFYASYLFNEGKEKNARKVLNSSLKLYPKNLLLNQLKLDLNLNKYQKKFDCKNLSHVIAEIFYITANALSSQQIYKFSNFYLNLSKHLNQNFISFNTLLAENFYNVGDLKQAKKKYKNISKQGEAYAWYSSKQKAKILIEEKKNIEAINLITKSYEKLSIKNIYETLDYAIFLKNNDRYKDAIKYYTKIINKIEKNHPLYPKVTDGRGVSYERLGEWEKAEKDLLSSLEASPDQAYVINYLAYSWIEQGTKIEKSLKMLEKANNLKSNDPYIVDSLGWALFKLKRYEESKQQLQFAVKLLPADPVINDHFGDALWKNGNKIQARYYWKYVLNLKDTEEELKGKIKKKLLSGIM
ncbi:MAG: hypothetical protein CMJ01_03790 [Pelagibacteraceae bacterium]|nr:hypothetical protein [Pelagibacteraceae bacterium]